ncbi:MAG: diphosphomevalonate decarboxylase, partial [Verrucomicrobia bacterium]|nr:diphosphomevalonate decarboxylase [Verrucomicrobiota bacterium]
MSRDTAGYTKQFVVDAILAGKSHTAGALPAEVFAPANIALVKYWGKRNATLNLPTAGSLSISLGALGSRVRLSAVAGPDRISLNGEMLAADTAFARRVIQYLDLFRSSP